MIDHVIMSGRRFRGQQEFIQAVIHPRNLARSLAANELDSFHGRSQPFVVPQVAAQAHEILGEMQSHRSRLLPRVTPQFFGQALDAFHGEAPCWKLVQNLSDPPELLTGNKRLLELL